MALFSFKYDKYQIFVNKTNFDIVKRENLKHLKAIPKKKWNYLLFIESCPKLTMWYQKNILNKQ